MLKLGRKLAVLIEGDWPASSDRNIWLWQVSIVDQNPCLAGRQVPILIEEEEL